MQTHIFVVILEPGPALLAGFGHEFRSLGELEFFAIGTCGSRNLLNDACFCGARRSSLTAKRLGLVNLGLRVDVMELRAHLSDPRDLGQVKLV
jgi:hypothetical protein